MIKNGVYFIVVAFLVAKLFKILIYANKRTCDVTRWTQNDVKSQKWNISEDFFCIELKLFKVVILITKFHDMVLCDISMATQCIPDRLHVKDKIGVPIPKKCYLLLMLIQCV